MGLSLKVFLLEGDRITRLPVRQFEQLRRGERRHRFPRLARKRVKCALVVVGTENRRAVAVRHVDYVVVPFGPDGRVDSAEQRRADRLAIDHVSLAFGSVSEPVVDIGPYVARSEHRREFRWTPTEAEESGVLELALKGR